MTADPNHTDTDAQSADTDDESVIPPSTGSDTEDDEYEIDMSLVPKGVEFVELQPDFVRPEGFLMVPRLNKKTGEISPPTATFVGILHDAVPWKDDRGKERFWYACTATADLPDATLTGVDENDEPFTRPIVKGDRVGISSSGAINALKTKKGHAIYLHWTGRQIKVKNGDMWEVKPAMVSKEPVEKAPF